MIQIYAQTCLDLACKVTAPFNNKWTVKFKIQTTVMLFTAINHCSGPLRKQKCLAEQGQRILLRRNRILDVLVGSIFTNIELYFDEPTG